MNQTRGSPWAMWGGQSLSYQKLATHALNGAGASSCYHPIKVVEPLAVGAPLSVRHGAISPVAYWLRLPVWLTCSTLNYLRYTPNSFDLWLLYQIYCLPKDLDKSLSKCIVFWHRLFERCYPKSLPPLSVDLTQTTMLPKKRSRDLD